MITTMKSMANVGGGSYYDATDIGQLVDAIGSILTEIQGTPSVFISASLPISVNTQGTYLNQVFQDVDQDGEMARQPQTFRSETRLMHPRFGDADDLDAVAPSGLLSILRKLLDGGVGRWMKWILG
jgi:hypothetical protein